MEPHSGPFRWFKIFTICLLSLFLFSPIFQIPSQAAPEPSPEQAVQAVQHAWELAQEIGIYHFTTDVEQTTYPAPAIANVGRSSSIQTYYLEGDVDSPAQAFYMTLWQGGGNAATQKDGIEIRMEGGEAYGRPIGGLWQEIDDFSGLFAPGSDPMAYLAGAKNITLVSSHTQYALRYMFDLDGPAFAAHMRDLLEDQLRRSGELPPGLSLDSSILYREMTGLGEIWLDAQGLPLRLLVDLEMPDPKTGERVSARIKTDFSNFAQQPETAIGFIAEIPTWDWGLILPQVAFWGLFCSGIIVFVLFRHSQKVYAALVIALIFSMVGTPLLQSAQVAAFYETQEQKQLEFESAQNERAANQEARDELLTSSWDPHQNPVFSDQSSVFSLQSPVFSPQSPITNLQSLAQHPRQGAISNLQSPSLDTDLDGIADAVEQALGTEINDPDTDGDTLNDGVEFLRLGTDPLSKDSDGDGIFDNVEVTGFMDVNGLHWYLDPNSPDTNKDSRIDTEECHQLVGRNTVGDRKCSDTDGDSTPDIFDRDDDGDDVADPVDIYPMGMVDRDGQHTNGSNPNAFTDDHPFELKIESLQTGLPVFVDFQLRPENPDHLTYALNVLDWPSEDIEGQIQHVKHTTFASDFTDEQLTGNPSAANGDMRLIPMLELTISGDHVPFARTNPAIDVAVRGVISGTIQLEQASSNRDNTSLDFSFDDPGQDYTVKIYEGGCPVSGTPVKTYTNRSDGDSSTWTGKKVVDLANGTYALTVSNGTDTVCAAIGNIINGPYIYAMIDPEPLRPYGISVREADQNGTLIAYIPLNMVPDETGGGRVAFSARMAYELGTDATWDQAQQVRMVWMLEMLTDSCDSNGFEEDWAAMTLSDPTLGMKAGSKDAAFRTWCSLPEHRTPDTSRIVHTYDDSWILTGLAVREDHGLDVAVVYEDPAQGDVATSENLWQLSRGLAATFLVGRDCEDNDVTTYPDYDPDTGSCNDDTYRDISVYTNGPDGNTIGNTNIYNRFDASGSAADGDDQRWGIPKAALQVARFRYDSQDYATYLAMTETPDILEANFAHTDEPTLLFAREEHYRSADLGAASKSGSVFTVNMVSSNQPLQTVTGLKWMPYAYDDDTGWSPIPIRELWDDLIIQYEDTFAQTYPEDTEAANLGRAVVARSYYVSLIQGLVQQVEIGSDLLWQPDLEGEADDWVYSVETQLEYISFFGWILADVLKEAFDTYGTKWR
ncbi:MAG: hypothetical protein KKD28_04155, partial [Chloroflexi bacterium]|nr:hypothetical protein [Chloroflexota bacterium]MBU1660646.1 hypothetical protein [Chloroflexota bacterium]